MNLKTLEFWCNLQSAEQPLSDLSNKRSGVKYTPDIGLHNVVCSNVWGIMMQREDLLKYSTSTSKPYFTTTFYSRAHTHKWGGHCSINNCRRSRHENSTNGKKVSELPESTPRRKGGWWTPPSQLRWSSLPAWNQIWGIAAWDHKSTGILYIWSLTCAALTSLSWIIFWVWICLTGVAYILAIAMYFFSV